MDLIIHKDIELYSIKIFTLKSAIYIDTNGNNRNTKLLGIFIEINDTLETCLPYFRDNKNFDKYFSKNTNVKFNIGKSNYVKLGIFDKIFNYFEYELLSSSYEIYNNLFNQILNKYFIKIKAPQVEISCLQPINNIIIQDIISYYSNISNIKCNKKYKYIPYHREDGHCQNLNFCENLNYVSTESTVLYGIANSADPKSQIPIWDCFVLELIINKHIPLNKILIYNDMLDFIKNRNIEKQYKIIQYDHNQPILVEELPDDITNPINLLDLTVDDKTKNTVTELIDL